MKTNELLLPLFFEITRAEYPSLFSFLFPQVSVSQKELQLRIFREGLKEAPPEYNGYGSGNVGNNWLAKNLSKNKRALADFALLRIRQGNGLKNY